MLGDKKVLYSGMQSTGNLTLGNYLGALKNWITLSVHRGGYRSGEELHLLSVPCTGPCRAGMDSELLHLHG